MTDHAELRRLAKRADALHGTPSLEHVFAITKFREAFEPKAILAMLDEIDGLKAENEALRKDAERWRYARTILPYEVIQDAQKDLESWNVGVSEAENKRCDEAIDAAIEGATQ
ncbi:hypothetical protein IPC563_05330 [Pseudomonas aeruginosa]|uniref:hypothetical protein n=1 Tax=Pseudomonas aeruginosa TaxID=287 RepID=UPI000F54B446|nr:hypothetical protein [Pseudomonas aeruginosa]RPZ37432.1 hypothetical protein IPC563_05330 [Pseudomonas aeruginosa]RUG83080.1 hypothetical protein IPC561_05350 [Pseudomonas aeruginosa]RUG96557.1 hypothetical protein IPC562_05780 [Pseudomonas aeruginosa]